MDVYLKDREVKCRIILRLKKQDMDRAGSVICVIVECGIGHIEISITSNARD